MRFYIVRHGETDWNKMQRVQGRSDIPLNDHGRHLARQTAEGMKGLPVDLAYTSPLLRAKETAEIILSGRQVLLTEEEGLIEMGFGRYEGMCCRKEEQQSGDGEMFRKFFSDTGNYIPPENGESVPALLKRTREFMERLYQDESLKEKHILISTHGAAMTAILNNIRNNLDPADFWKYRVPPNCAVTVVDVEAGVPSITEENIIYYKDPVRKWKVV